MIVLDASAAVLGLLADGEAREQMRGEALAGPHLIDAEVLHALRGQVRRGTIDDRAARRAVRAWRALGLERFAVAGLAERIWDLRDNVTAYDACYVALAEVLDVPLVTADARLAATPGPRCRTTVLRS